MLYCCGKFHLLLVAEASLDKRARMTTHDFGVSVFQADSGAAAIWILGNGTTPRCETLLQKNGLGRRRPKKNGSWITWSVTFSGEIMAPLAFL